MNPLSHSPAYSHRAAEAPQRRRRGRWSKEKCGGPLKQRRSGIGLDVNEEDKEMQGGGGEGGI